MTKSSVIIVGSGVAGLSAARYLTDHTDFHCTVLEANENRVGGRIWSFVASGYPGKPVELGAMWIHQGSDSHHPVRRIFDEMGIKVISHDLDESKFTQIYDKDGKMHDSNEFHKLAHFSTAFHNLRDDVIKRGLPDASLEEAFEILQKNSNKSGIIRDFLIPYMEAYHGATKDKVSLIYSDGVPGSKERLELIGNDVVIPDGFEHLVHHLISEGKKFKLILGRQVTCVNVNYNSEKEKQKICVTCKQPTTGHFFDYHADHVIIAVPLSVLQRGGIEFCPPLPDRYKNCVQKFGFENKLKVLLIFDRVFWSENKACFGIEMNDPAGFPVFFSNLHKIHGLPALLASIASQGVAVAEKMSEDEIVEKVLEKLTKIFGPDAVVSARLTFTKIMNWGLESFINGAYSFAKIGITTKDAYDIREPIKPFLFFAGEHTAMPENAHGTVHGAYISGRRSAREVLDATNFQEYNRKEVEDISINFSGKVKNPLHIEG